MRSLTDRFPRLFSILIWLFMLAFGTSCISNRRVVLLQQQDLKRPQHQEVPASFNVEEILHRVEPGDILYVKIDHLSLSQPTYISSGQSIVADRTQPIHPYLNGYAVSDSGLIDLPVLGKVDLEGLTLREAQDEVQRRASQMYKQATVRLYLLNFNVFIMGEVARPGQYPVYNQSINVLEAISLAGGFREYASRQQVKILRQVQGKDSIFYLDLTDDAALQNKNFYLRPNDVVMVRPLGMKKFTGQNLQLTLAGLTTLVALTSLILNATQP